jgi:hypothetical protein
MKQIPLTQGKFAIVDDEDFDVLNGFSWFHNKGYAYRMLPGTRKNRKRVSMQDAVNPPRQGEVNDHINHTTLDNRRTNLRSVSRSINSLNKTTIRAYKDYRKFVNPWFSTISIGKKTRYCGYFQTEQEAIDAKKSMLAEMF